MGSIRERVFTIEWYFEETFGRRRAQEIGEIRRQAADASRSQLERSVAEGRLLGKRSCLPSQIYVGTHRGVVSVVSVGGGHRPLGCGSVQLGARANAR